MEKITSSEIAVFGGMANEVEVTRLLQVWAIFVSIERDDDRFPPIEGRAWQLYELLRAGLANPVSLHDLVVNTVKVANLNGFADFLEQSTQNPQGFAPSVAEKGMIALLAQAFFNAGDEPPWRAKVLDGIDQASQWGVPDKVLDLVAMLLKTFGKKRGVLGFLLFWGTVAGIFAGTVALFWPGSQLQRGWNWLRGLASVPAPIAPVVLAGAPVVVPPAPVVPVAATPVVVAPVVPAVVAPVVLPAPVVPVAAVPAVVAPLDCPPANQRPPAVGLEWLMNLGLGLGSAGFALFAVWRLITIGLGSLKGTLDSSQMIDAYWAIIVMIVWRFLFPLLDRNDSRSWTVAREQMDRSMNVLLPGAWRDRGGYRQIAVTVNMVVMFAAVGLQLQYDAIGTGNEAVAATTATAAVPAISKIGGLGWWLPTLAFLTFGSVELLGNKWPHLLGTASSRLDLRRLGLAMVGLIILTGGLVVANFVSETGTAAAYHQVGEAVGIPLDPAQKRCHTARQEVDVLLKRYRFGDRALTGLGTWPAVCESSAPPPTPDCWKRQLVVLENGVLAPFATATSEERGRVSFGGYCDQHSQEKACTCK